MQEEMTLGPNLNDVYTERGLPKCRHSKGGCVDFSTMDLVRMQTRGGEGVQNPENCVDVI